MVKGTKSWKRLARAKGKVAKKVVVGPKCGVAFYEGLQQSKRARLVDGLDGDDSLLSVEDATQPRWSL